MAHSRTARKAIRQNQRRRTRNKAEMSGMRTQLKKVHAAIESKDGAAAAAELPRAQKNLDKAAKKNRLHPNRAARIKSRLAKAVDRLSKS
ncbi:MAG: 30S ribosomal protein S20 [Planctomycetota bacterium]|jgi:small subunit ribosomal protein S20